MITGVLIYSFSQQISLQAGVLGQAMKVDIVDVRKSAFQAKARSGKETDVADVYELSFREGRGMLADREIKFNLLVNPGTTFAKFKIDQPAAKFGTPEFSKAIHGHSKGTSCGRGVASGFFDIRTPEKASRTGMASDMIAFKMTARKLAGGGYEAFIRAKAPEQKTWIMGRFTFMVGKG